MREPYPVAYISAPVPLAFWRREEIARLETGEWVSSAWQGEPVGFGYNRSQARQCALPDLAAARAADAKLDAFLTWSRAPFAERAGDGSVILRDARYYDPRARDRFSLALPGAACEELAGR